tara:strand:+ start:5553 stop:6902 length:1350 start_codon:yes stop_codon:yes gene_type:complete
MSFAQIMIASRFLDLSEFGVYALAWAVAVIFNTFLFTGYYHALLRSQDFEADRDTTFWVIATLGACGAIVLGGIGLAIGGGPGAIGTTFLLLAGFPLLRAPTSWNEAILLRRRRVRTVSTYVVVGEILATTVVYLGLKAGLGIPALVLGRYVAAGSDLVLTTLLVRCRPVFHFDRAAILRGWNTARPLWIASGVGMFSNYGADLILGAFLNPAAVGAYRGGARMSQTVADLVMQPIEMLSWSRFSRLEKEGKSAELREAWLQTIALGAASVWPILLSFALFAEDIVSLIFADIWGPVAPILVIMSGARAIYFLSILLEPTMVCRDRGRAQLLTRGFGAIVLLVSLLAFGRNNGEAAAYAYGLTALTVAVISMWLMMAELGISLLRVLRAFVPAVTITLLCLAVTLATVDVRAMMGQLPAFVASVAVLATLWAGSIALFIRFRLLVLPTS